ncbi:membrane-associated, eicosanoid/glutathione metabolism protein [Chytriomyces sp. MP71]|nr:membrane-associated, eicosanoid/glutathione metabolism protein [Chytriomyces sp. MP71]
MSVTPLLPVTGTWALPFVGLHLAFQIPIIVLRRSNRISIGDGSAQLAKATNEAQRKKLEDTCKDLAFRIRAQANFIENAHFALLLLAVAELNAMPATVLHAMFATLFAARVLHYWTMADFRKVGVGLGRVLGVMGTMVVLVSAAAWSLGTLIF